VRDINDWMFHFERQAGPKLKQLFSADDEALPQELARRLQILGSVESSSGIQSAAADTQDD
jgi:hypothetical protein